MSLVQNSTFAPCLRQAERPTRWGPSVWRPVCVCPAPSLAPWTPGTSRWRLRGIYTGCKFQAGVRQECGPQPAVPLAAVLHLLNLGGFALAVPQRGGWLSVLQMQSVYASTAFSGSRGPWSEEGMWRCAERGHSWWRRGCSC